MMCSDRLLRAAASASALALALTLAAGAARADAPADTDAPAPAPASPHRARNAILLGSAIATYAGLELFGKDSLAPGDCRLCGVDGLDAHVRSSLRWSNTDAANTTSNIVGYGVAPLAALGSALIVSRAGAGGGWGQFVDDTLAIGNAVAYTQLAVELVKYTVGRERPYEHYEPVEDAHGTEDDLSLVSGHTAFAFTFATAAGVIAHRRHTRFEPAIWAVGMTLAAATGYLRIAADRHYLTDVLGGAAFGVAGGILIPRLFDELPGLPTIAPAESGAGATVGYAQAF